MYRSGSVLRGFERLPPATWKGRLDQRGNGRRARRRRGRVNDCNALSGQRHNARWPLVTMPSAAGSETNNTGAASKNGCAETAGQCHDRWATRPGNRVHEAVTLGVHKLAAQPSWGPQQARSRVSVVAAVCEDEPPRWGHPRRRFRQASVIPVQRPLLHASCSPLSGCGRSEGG